jgi:hypothetical protein
MSVSHTTTHVTDAKARLARQFKGKARIEALVAALAQQNQDLEDALYELLTQRWLSAAVGVQLDGIGQIVGESRLGKDDATYKLHIAARILINLSTGTPEELIAIVRLLIGAGKTIEYVPEYPAAQTLKIDTLLPSAGSTVADLIVQARSGGVGTKLEWWETEPVFGFLGATGDTEGFAGLLGDFASISPFTGEAYGCAADCLGGLFLLASTSGRLATSPDGSAWTERTNPAADVINCFAYGTSGYVLGGDNSACASSPTGGVWTSRNAQFSGEHILTGIYGGGFYVLAGSSGMLSRSADGRTWVAKTSQFGTSQINCIGHDGTNFIIAGASGKLSTSPDGDVWTSRTSQFDTRDILALACSANLSVIVGAGGMCGISLDHGATWSLIEAGFGTDTILDVAYWPERELFVLVGQAGKIVTAVYGGMPALQESGTTEDLSKVRCGGSSIRAVGSAGTLIASDNGTDWRVIETDWGEDLQILAGGAGRFVLSDGIAGVNYGKSTDSIVGAGGGTLAYVEGT